MTRQRSVNWSRALVYGVLPGVALLLAMSAGLLKWKDSSLRGLDAARSESVAAARDSAISVLSFRYDTIDNDVATTREKLTGGFLDEYTEQTQRERIPNAKQRRMAATAVVSAAAPEVVTPNKAVVLLFVDQSVKVGDAAPVATESDVRVTLDKVGSRWLISEFDEF